MADSTEYVVLRCKIPNAAIPMGQTLGSGPSREHTLEVTRKVLTQVEVSDIRSDPNLLVAPSIPLSLVSPKSRAEVDCATEHSTWGKEAIGANDCQLNGAGAVVAVLDTGIDKKHQAFRHLAESIIERDFTGEGNGDVDGHGTHCAGTIFGSTVDGVEIGIAPGIERALVGKVIGSQGASTAALVDAIQWALHHEANIISMSLGIDFPGFVKELVESGYPADLATSKALEAYRENTRLFDALGSFIRAGAAFRQTSIVIAAAGNSSQRDVNPEHTVMVEPPAAADNMVSVGAIARSGVSYSLAPFSNSGPTLVAPGVEILSAKIDDGLCVMSGTSMATPHVAGAAALWIEHQQRHKRRLTPEILLSKLTGTARPLDDANQRDIGVGIVTCPVD